MDNLETFTAENIKLIAQRIKSIRKAKGYKNHEQFAYEHNIARAQYGRYERGVNLSINSLSKILHAHNMSLAEFFSEGFEISPTEDED